MNKLDEIKDEKVKKKVQVYLEDVDISAIAMTSGHGACSQMNEPYILKSKDLDLTEDQIDILKKIGEYDKLTKTKEEDEMSDELKKELEDQKKINEDLQKKLDDVMNILEKEQAEKELMKVQKSIEDFELEEDLKKSVSEILVTLEGEARGNIVKAFTILKEFEVKKEEPENSLAKALKEEKGAIGEEPVELSLDDRINKAREIV